MGNPNRISGWCPHYDHPSGRCYLSGSTPSSGTHESKCKSDRNCKTCGNYEAWASGKNYKGK
ncbi:hypothetical protein FACS189494_01120 [Spirochaetia bacterium]|nr:hypothetical protein FACS189494_01120 [Spirochaetia bacterium]